MEREILLEEERRKQEVTKAEDEKRKLKAEEEKRKQELE
jgi:hypothetical protein